MRKFYVIVEDVSRYIFEVEAESEDDARGMVEESDDAQEDFPWSYDSGSWEVIAVVPADEQSQMPAIEPEHAC